MGYLLDGLKDVGALDHLHLIVLGDHGMVDVCRDNSVLIDKLLPEWPTKWANITRVPSPILSSLLISLMTAIGHKQSSHPAALLRIPLCDAGGLVGTNFRCLPG